MGARSVGARRVGAQIFALFSLSHLHFRSFVSLSGGLLETATALLSSFFLDRSWSCRTSILEGAIFHKMSYCKFF